MSLSPQWPVRRQGGTRISNLTEIWTRISGLPAIPGRLSMRLAYQQCVNVSFLVHLHISPRTPAALIVNVMHSLRA